MTTGFDLDEIERLLAAATVGEWVQPYGRDDPTIRAADDEDFIIYDEGGHTARDAALIVALKRSAPAMIAAIRELRAENARLKEDVRRQTSLAQDHFRNATRLAARAALGEPQ